jgi:hypothetical protein
MKKKLTLFILAIGMLPMLRSQNLGQIGFRIMPQNAIVKFDSVKVERYGAVLEAPTGTYRLRMWAPKHALVDTSVTLIADSLIVIQRLLADSPDWIQFKRDLSNYDNAKARPWFFLGGSVVSAGVLAITQKVVFSPQEQEHLTIARGLQDDWMQSTTPARDEEVRAALKTARADYLKFSTVRWGTGIALGGASLFCFWKTFRGLVKFGKMEKPVWEETPLLSQIQIAPALLPNGRAGIGFAFNF